MREFDAIEEYGEEEYFKMMEEFEEETNYGEGA